MSLNLKDIETPTQYLIPRDGLDRPMVVPVTGGRPEPYTRTTTFIDVIEDKSALDKWARRAVLVGAARRASIIDRVRAADPYGIRAYNREDAAFRDKLDELTEEAITVAGAHDRAEKGTSKHALSELVDAGKPLPENATEGDILDMAEYRMITAMYGLEFSSVERFVVIPELKVGGTPDRICSYCGPGPTGRKIKGNFIFDLKTGTTEYGGLKMASQLGAYSRATFYDPTVFPAPPYHHQVRKKDEALSCWRAHEGTCFEAYKAWGAWCATEFDADTAAQAYEPLPKINKQWGIILNLPADSGQAELYWADLRIGWKVAKEAQRVREMRRLRSKALIPFAA